MVVEVISRKRTAIHNGHPSDTLVVCNLTPEFDGKIAETTTTTKDIIIIIIIIIIMNIHQLNNNELTSGQEMNKQWILHYVNKPKDVFFLFCFFILCFTNKHLPYLYTNLLLAHWLANQYTTDPLAHCAQHWDTDANFFLKALDLFFQSSLMLSM